MQHKQEKNLLNRIRIITDHRKEFGFSKKKNKYYEKYALLVFETLKEPLFQKFIQKIIKKENMKMTTIRDIQIRTFPFKKENGNGLAGKCTNKGTICIFPKGFSFIQKLTQKWRHDKINFYIKGRARAALIHELLHIKYLGKEYKVRELTRKYFEAFTRLKNPDAIGSSNKKFFVFGFGG